MAERPDLDGIGKSLQIRGYVGLHEIWKLFHYARDLERESGEKERITKLWCQKTHALPICGNTAPEGRSEEIVRALRAEAGGSPVGGCGKLIEWLMAYRCLECGRWMHAGCLRQHFAEHGDQNAALERDLTSARLALEKYGAHLDDCAAYLGQGCTCGWSALPAAALREEPS